MDKLVSIILPCYNAEKYLTEALDSIIKQTYKNIEIIAVNDNSTDATADILEKYSRENKNIQVINNKNKGLGNALNLGIEVAKGEYIARMDADDICFKERIENQINYLYSNTKIDIISCFSKNINADGSFNSYDTYLNCTQPLSNLFFSLFENPLTHPAVIGKAHIFKSNHYEIDNLVSEDYFLWTTLLKKGFIIGNLNQRLFNYRKNLSSASNVGKSIMQKRHIDISNDMLQHFLNTKIEEHYHRIILLRCEETFSTIDAKKAITLFKNLTTEFIKKFKPDSLAKKEIITWQQQRIIKIIASGFLKANAKEKIKFLSLIFIYPRIFFQWATYKNIFYRIQWLVNSR